MPQLWQGRASKAVDSRVNDFNSSIRFDARMIEQDIQGSLVHSAMLGRQGIISRQDVDDIHKGLHSILDDLHSGALEIDPNAEDVHTFVEQTLTARVGDAGKRLHTGRSRNDQVALDIRLNLRAASEHIQGQIKELITVLCDQAEKGAGYVMPGYTHLQRAQPVTFGHQLMAYAWMLLRDLGRLQDATRRMDAECPLGSGALAGTTYPLDRFYTAEQLGFAAPCGNSIDGVSDRDFCIELCSAMATCMMHLSRLSEEIILWCSWEFKFIELDDAFTTGSSIMPQKKNPDVTELIRGKTGRVYGDLNTLLVMMKGIPLAYDKDMQEDKEAIFDAVDTLELCLRTVTPMLATMTPLPANMRRAAAKGFINATDCADYLTKKGMPFRDAYKCTGTMVAACIREGKTLEELTLDEFKQYSDLFEDDVYTAIDLTTCSAVKFTEKVARDAKGFLLPSSFFEYFGFMYLGPIDGHDIPLLEKYLNYCKRSTKPILLHILTKKGKGLEVAMRNPEKFHGATPYDIVTGESTSNADKSIPNYQDAMGKTLLKLAQKDPKTVGITAAMASGVSPFGPDRIEEERHKYAIHIDDYA